MAGALKISTSILCSRRIFRILPAGLRNVHFVACGNVVHPDKNESDHFRIKSHNCLKKRFSSLSINNKTICEITPSNSEHVLSQYDTILLDCDGVLWLTDDKTQIPGIPQTITKLRQLGKQMLFVTNNSLPGRDEFAEKFEKYGFQASIDEIFTVCYAGAYYLKHFANIQRSVYAIGTPGMEFELKQMGLKYYGFGPETDEPSRDNDKLLSMKFYDDVDAVFVGFDEYFSYVKMYKAASYLSHESCLFIGTTNLGGGGKISPTRRQPITAAIVDSVAHAAKRKPTLMNKPNIHMYNCIQAKYPNIDKARTLFIGDSVKADIGFAKTVGIDSALVLMGSCGLDTVEENPGLEPEYYLKSLAVLGQ